jgi:hypothetical protein
MSRTCRHNSESVQPKPSEIDHGPWQQEGRLVRVEYSELTEPVPLASIPERWRIEHGAPFTRSGGVQQGYLFALDQEFVERLVGRFPQLAATLPDVTSELSSREVSIADAFSSFRTASRAQAWLLMRPCFARSSARCWRSPS